MLGRWRRRSTLRVGLFGDFGWGNLGNEGSLQSVLGWLSEVRPDAEPVVICHDPRGVQELHGIAATHMSWPRATTTRLPRLYALAVRLPGKALDFLWLLRVLRRIDVVIIPGTGIFEGELGIRPWQRPYALACLSLAARLTRTRVAFVSVGASPVRSRTTARFFRWAAGQATYRSFRDHYSQRTMAASGVDTSHDTVYPDVAYALSTPDCDPVAAAPLTVAIGVMSYMGHFGSTPRGAAVRAQYTTKMVTFAEWLLASGYRVRLLTGDDSDLPVAQEILRRVVGPGRQPDEQQIQVCASRSLAELMVHLAGTDVGVVTRYHNVVCATMLARPIISIGYATKNSELMTAVGLDDFCQHIDQLDVDLLIAQFERLVKESGQLTVSIADAVAGFGDRVAQQYRELAAVVLPPHKLAMRGRS